MRPLRIALVFRRPVLLESVAHLLAIRPGFEVAAAAAYTEEVLHTATDRRPDVILVGPVLAGSAAEVARSVGEGPRVLAVLDDADEHLISRLAESGVAGLLSTAETFDIWCEGIEAVTAREVLWCSPLLMSELVQRLGPRGQASTLSRRERELLKLVAEGHPVREIACALRVAEGTVRNSLSALYARLGVRTRAQAAAWAWAHGLAAVSVQDRDPPSRSGP